MRYEAGRYDVIVVGAGHAGCEAALACARMGASTLALAMNLDAVANMACNPNIGGTAKGHLAVEVDALGGEIGKNADRTLIQSKMLNLTKGPAVHSLRAQIDRRRYQDQMKLALERQPNLDLRQGEAIELLTEGKAAVGIVTHTGAIYRADAVILCTGTYLKGRIIIGDIAYPGGPDGMFPSNLLSENLRSHGIEILRLKTGTPPRINAVSVDTEKMERQDGDREIRFFSFENEDKKIDFEQIPCYLTWTNEETKRIIQENLHRSPLFSGVIEGRGPRYCPSIEDKIVRFAERERHQVFIEPMGRDTLEMYVQGMSSSLPEDVQVKMIRSLRGMECARFTRTAYAIEYDAVVPSQLRLSLESSVISGLFTAGQINGSSGYEEAAAQGIMAGINAVRKLRGNSPVILDRSQAYIGVLIDDLATKGTEEPYRMMTSRAEYRLLLRQDNADERLTPLGYELGLISEERYQKFRKKYHMIYMEIKRIKETTVAPSLEVSQFLAEKNSSGISTGIKLEELLRRPEIDYAALKAIDSERPELGTAAAMCVETNIKYEGYIRRQKEDVARFKKRESKLIPQDTDYLAISGLRTEAAQKLAAIRPVSVGQAARISGVSPADISVLLIHLEAGRRRKDEVRDKA